mmetsp:Transcript_16968/g.45714  ORF Transcript_16968/g.45714 Transcript_16968/m.45714 type:complete len:212 (+) Transcript_16968:1043-1678(+)
MNSGGVRPSGSGSVMEAPHLMRVSRVKGLLYPIAIVTAVKLFARKSREAPDLARSTTPGARPVAAQRWRAGYPCESAALASAPRSSAFLMSRMLLVRAASTSCCSGVPPTSTALTTPCSGLRTVTVASVSSGELSTFSNSCVGLTAAGFRTVTFTSASPTPVSAAAGGCALGVGLRTVTVTSVSSPAVARTTRAPRTLIDVRVAPTRVCGA